MKNLAQYVRGQLWVHLNGKTFVYEPENKLSKKGKSTAKIKNGTILSPMPGKIIKVFKKTGDAVVEGEPVVVMSAMKMEYVLKSDVAGTVKSVDCKVDDQVALGKILVKIDEQKN